jgi:hypothetical protein
MPVREFLPLPETVGEAVTRPALNRPIVTPPESEAVGPEERNSPDPTQAALSPSLPASRSAISGFIQGELDDNPMMTR